MLMASGCCCKRVLLWFNTPSLITLYENLGLEVDTSGDWTGNLENYKLIISLHTSDPSWWGSIADTSWNGRILLFTDFSDGTGAGTVFAYINTKNGLTGITMLNTLADPAGGGGFRDGVNEADPLTNGITVRYGAAQDALKVSGGTVLCRDADGVDAWLTRNKVGNVDFVIAGSNGIRITTDNTPFLQRLATVAL